MRLWHLAARETLQHGRSLRNWAICVAAVLLTVLGTLVGTRDYQIRQDEFNQRVQQRDVDRAAIQRFVVGMNPERGLRVLRPPSTASILVRGADAVAPAFWDFGPPGVTDGPIAASLAQDAEVGAMLDVSSVVRIVLGVLALVFALDAIAGARASGTLRAVVSQPVRWQVLVAGKFIGASVALAAALLTVSVAALVTVWAEDRALVSADFVRCAVACDVAAFAYLLTMFATGVMACSLVQTRAASVATCVALWAFLALLAPQMMTFGARVAVPVMSRELVERHRQTAYDAQLVVARRHVGAIFAQLAGAGVYQLSYHLPQASQAIVENEWESEARALRELVEAIDRPWRQAVAERDRLAARLAATNPATAFTVATGNLAGTGPAASARWNHAVIDYTEQLRLRLFDDLPSPIMAVTDQRGEHFMLFERHAALRFADMPVFAPPDVPLSGRIRESLPWMMLLVGYLGVLVACACAAFRWALGHL